MEFVGIKLLMEESYEEVNIGNIVKSKNKKILIVKCVKKENIKQKIYYK